MLPKVTSECVVMTDGLQWRCDISLGFPQQGLKADQVNVICMQVNARVLLLTWTVSQANSRIVTDLDCKPSELAVIKTSWTVPVVTA